MTVPTDTLLDTLRVAPPSTDPSVALYVALAFGVMLGASYLWGRKPGTAKDGQQPD